MPASSSWFSVCLFCFPAVGQSVSSALNSHYDDVLLHPRPKVAEIANHGLKLAELLTQINPFSL